jgi:hypothetical protein
MLAPGRATRRTSASAADGGNELEAVEHRHAIERIDLVGQRLDIANVEPTLGNTVASDLNQPSRGVDPGDARAGVRGQSAKRPCATPQVENDLLGADIEPSDRVLVL